MADRIVIVGAGQAGAELAVSLRAGGHAGPVTLIGDETSPPYQRPPLSKKYLLGEATVDRLWLKPPAFYAAQGVELVTGTEVVAIDREGRTALLADGRTLSYDMLALTTGATPRRLPEAMGGSLDGAHVVRGLRDADAMAPELAPGRRAVVVGGGYIGLEAAAVAASRGLDVTVLEAAPRILRRVACEQTSDYFRELHRSRGVTIREGVSLARLEERGGRAVAAVLEDGERLPLDLAIVGVGIAPNVALAEAAGLRIEDGIAVDARCRTSDPAIFAAGDCASFPWRGRRIRLESVQNAIDMAQAAAASMLGSDAAYDPAPWFWSDQFDVKLQIAGLSQGHDRVVKRAGRRPGSLSVWCYRGAELLSVDAMNDGRAYMTGKRWLEAGVSPDPDRLADEAMDLAAAA